MVWNHSARTEILRMTYSDEEKKRAVYHAYYTANGTLNKAAKELGCSTTSIKNWSKDKRYKPSVKAEGKVPKGPIKSLSEMPKLRADIPVGYEASDKVVSLPVKGSHIPALRINFGDGHQIVLSVETVREIQDKLVGLAASDPAFLDRLSDLILQRLSTDSDDDGDDDEGEDGGDYGQGRQHAGG